MKDGLLSPHWYRVAQLKPRLYDHVKVHRHEYRGLIWYLLEDSTTGRGHRFNPAAYQFIGMLDGKRSIDDIYQHIFEQLDDFAPGQDEVLQILGQLHAADLLKLENRVDADELFERQTRQRGARLRQRLLNPVAQKFPLWDPDDFLDRHFPRVRWIFSWPMALIWFLLVGYGLLQLAQHWPQVRAYFTINALSPYNLVLMFLLYPPIKFLHELGHAFSAKLEGGEIHEMGINFLLFMPIPYVNVSTAAHFRSKYRRMLVGAAGILVETFLATLGLLLFLNAEPGLVRDIGFNIFVIGGVSSLFFNGNPLLKYDGYYILADAIDIPNLYQRAAQYWRYFFQRYLFGLRNIQSPASAPGETAWFIGYSVASQIYRLLVIWFIFVIVTEKFFVLGVVLAAWLLALQVLWPLARALAFIVSSPALSRHRARALTTTLASTGLLVAILGYLPIPSYTLSQGVVWQPDEALLKAEHEGFAQTLLVPDRHKIAAGDPVLRLDDPFLATEALIAAARLQELQGEYRAKRVSNSYQAGLALEELKVARSEFDHLRDKTQTMTVSAFKSGTLHIPKADDLPGRYLRQGEIIGYILDGPPNTVRLAVRQEHIGQMRANIDQISLRFASDPTTSYPARLLRQAPEATGLLPSAALGTQGGGPFLVRPDNELQLLDSQRIFIIDLEFDPGDRMVPLGTRAWVRFEHGGEPLAAQLYRRVRQVFLRQFNV